MRSAIAALIGLVVLCFGAASANANLQFSIQRTDQAIFIIVEGEFEFEDDLTEFTRLHRRERIDFVVFDSPGGNVAKAIELGRLIRAAGLRTVQLRRLECASACAYAFFGGKTRYADPGSIGMHRASFPNNIDAEEATRSVQKLTAIVIEYMHEMGVDPALLALALDHDADDMRYLTGEEMHRFGVITNETVAAREGATAPSPHLAPPAQTTSPALLKHIPRERSGTVRHPNGKVPLKPLPDPDSADLVVLPNGTRLDILFKEDRWFRVKIGIRNGYLHQSWVVVDQYQQYPFAERHIQIKSFSSFENAASYVRSSSLPLAAILASNGWYAITLDQTMSLTEARIVLERLKKENRVPPDSYITYGNTYVRKVCCD